MALPTVFCDGEMPPEAAAYLVSRADSWFCRWQIVPVDVPSHLTTAAGGHIDADTGVDRLLARSAVVPGTQNTSSWESGCDPHSRRSRPTNRGRPSSTSARAPAFTQYFKLRLAGHAWLLPTSRSLLSRWHTFNAEINGVGGAIDFRIGSLEPTPERFDVVVSNLPFVITPLRRASAWAGSTTGRRRPMGDQPRRSCGRWPNTLPTPAARGC